MVVPCTEKWTLLPQQNVEYGISEPELLWLQFEFLQLYEFFTTTTAVVAITSDIVATMLVC